MIPYRLKIPMRTQRTLDILHHSEFVRLRAGHIHTLRLISRASDIVSPVSSCTLSTPVALDVCEKATKKNEAEYLTAGNNLRRTWNPPRCEWRHIHGRRQVLYELSPLARMHDSKKILCRGVSECLRFVSF